MIRRRCTSQWLPYLGIVSRVLDFLCMLALFASYSHACSPLAASALQAHPSSPPRLSPPAPITYHLGHTLAPASPPNLLLHSMRLWLQPVGRTRNSGGASMLHARCSMGSSGPTVNVTRPSTCPACTCGCSCRASLNLLMKLGPAAAPLMGLCHAPAANCIVLGSTSDYLIAASHNHEEASSPRLSMPNYNRMKIFDPPPSSLICSFVSSSAASTPPLHIL